MSLYLKCAFSFMFEDIKRKFKMNYTYTTSQILSILQLSFSSTMSNLNYFETLLFNLLKIIMY